MVYHKLILSEIIEKECRIPQKEEEADLLYVEDVCEYLWEKGNDQENLGTYNMASGEKSYGKRELLFYMRNIK